MQGVTTAIVAFLLLCLVFPHMIKHRPQYYFALAAILIVIFLDALAHMVAGKASTDPTQPVSPGAFAVFCYFIIALLQIFAVILSVMAAGGISARELAGEMANAYEVMRRGEETKEVIIPIRGRVPGAPGGAAKAAGDEDRPRERIDLNFPDDDVKPAAPSPASPQKPDADLSLPLDE